MATSALLYASTLLVALALPFEGIRPVLAFEPWLSITNLQLLVALSGSAWLLHAVAARALPELDTPLTQPALLLLALAVLSALLAPEHNLDALKFASRLALGLFVCVLIVSIATTTSRVLGILWAMVLGAGISVLMGLGEASGWGGLKPLLDLFKEAPTRVGSELRVSGSFQYATITAMYFEMIVPLALVLVATTRNRAGRGAALLIALGGIAVIHLTLTRAGIATVAIVVGLMLGLACLRPAWHALRLPAALALLGFLAIGLVVWDPPVLRARLITQDHQAWYAATYSVPPLLSVSTAGSAAVTVELRNTGHVTWEADGEHAFALAYYWLDQDGERRLLLPPSEVPLPHDVGPGQTVSVVAEVHANLPPGEYRLAWGMLQRDILWFRHRGVPEPETVVRVEPDTAAPPLATSLPGTAPRDDVSQRLPTLTRPELWRAALQMIVERPLLGVGPDNFRRLHGSYLGLSDWDERIYANNLYLELLATLGIAGAGAFGWLIVRAVGQVFLAARIAAARSSSLWALGLSGGLFAVLLHGFLDYFLWTSSISLLFWVTLGLVVAVARLSVPLPGHTEAWDA